MTKTIRILFFLLFLTSVSVFATHNRAGEITYEHLKGFSYRITITTYTQESSTIADRCELRDVDLGDGTIVTIPRINGTYCSTDFPDCGHCGVSLGGNVKKNIYQIDHTYPGTGTYRITMEDPNRNEGVINIPNSVNVVFFLYSELIIIPAGIPNSSPVLTYPPIDNGCVDKVYEHNPGAIDKDISKYGHSDSLSYRLVTCLGNGGVPIPNYTLPDQWPAGSNNNISIDVHTGTLSWDSPQQQGVYNVAILVEEWRKIGNSVVKMGSVLRDLQITIGNCAANNLPEILPVSDTCVTATQLLKKTITAVDMDYQFGNGNFQSVTLSASGDPFYVIGNRASFPSKTEERTVSQEFTWATQCNHVRAYPYFVVFRVEDNFLSTRLVDYLDWKIKVNAPPPSNIIAEPFGAGMNVSWDYISCTQAAGYKIYRKTDSIGYVAPACETGIPASTGYQYVGKTDGLSNTLFYDNDNGRGLVSGQKYCYMVYAYFDDGDEGYPSEEACAILLKEVPIITRVSVNSTNLTTGSDTVKWSKPTDIDMQKFPGPYQYKILRDQNNQGFVEMGVSIIDADLNNLDSIFIDKNLNTKENQHTYKVEVYSNDTLIGPSRIATSPWLKAKSLDNRVELSLSIDVPWINNTMYVYRQNTSGNFIFQDSANTLIYTDSNLVNGKEYCYYITTSGDYSDTALEFPLLNNSQILCATPIDKQAPCPPQNLVLNSECELFFNDLSWLNPNDICDTTDDVVSYNVYYKPYNEGDLEIIETIQGAGNTTILFDQMESVAGCYAITAIDSFNNESPMSNVVCADNCPYYELPNIFTPGIDGQNDYFVPLPKWRYVQRVEMHLYNRWGDELYVETNPALGWDGKNTNGVDMPDGVYFYICNVYEIRLEGIVERILKGTVTLLHEKSGKPK